jgi:hypothetical protein
MVMVYRCKKTLVLFLGIALLSATSLHAQARKDLQYIKEYLSGHEFQITYREGGVQYGTFFFLDVHFCASGSYWSSNQSRKQTVLGNEQVSTWNDSGTWDVLSVQGYPSMRYTSVSGVQDVVPLQIQADGTVRPTSGAFMKRLSRARCR